MKSRYLYIHGLNSDVNSWAFQEISKFLDVIPLGYNYAKSADYCYEQLCAQIEANYEEAENSREVVKLIGTSLGAYWALYLAKKYAIACAAFNPVINPYKQLRPFLGRNQNEYTLEEYELTDEILNSYQAFELNTNLAIKPYIILGENDEIIPFEPSLTLWKSKAYCIITDEEHVISDFSVYQSLLQNFA